jgi:peptidoglycan/LPS O-acetylase OafA/YrhL
MVLAGRAVVAASPSETRPSDPAERVAAIDGLRGWLAWIVVLAHIVQITGLDRTHPHWWLSQFLAREAVIVFIIISGFVITGLAITQRERWDVFILRRAFRIFPIYLLLLPVGAGALYLADAALVHMAWAADPAFRYDDTVRGTIASVEAAPRIHIVSHLFLFQGLIPNSAVPFAETSFLGPAWSLSLEWQFYLLAPLLIALLRNPNLGAATLAVLAVLALLYRLGLFGEYSFPSVLPAAIPWFLFGVGARLLFGRLMLLFAQPAAAALFALLCAIAFPSILAIAIWAIFLAMLSVERPAAAHDAALGAFRRFAFQSPLALAQGARSYAIYLVHWPIVQGMAFLLLPLRGWTQIEALLLMAAAAIPATLIAAHCLYVGVERPMMRLGARFAARMQAPASASPPLATGVRE